MKQTIFSILQSEHSFDWLYQFLAMAFVSMVPFAPIPLVAALIAGQHSFEIGLLINMTGTITGSVILFLLSKNVLRNIAMKYLAKRQTFTKYLQLIETNSFLAVFLGRIIPIMPSAGVNLIAGISNVRLFPFIAATFLGKLPTILGFSLAGHQIATGNWHSLLIIALYLLALFLLGSKLKKKWQK